MASLIDRYFGLERDPISRDLFVVGSQLNIIAILTVYILFVKKWGPKFMENREAYNLRGVLIVYNVIQILANAYVSLSAIYLFIYHRKWTGRCLGANISLPEVLVINLSCAYTYCALKVVDLMDTVFFILRKHYKQVTFLHFYHHILVCVGATLTLQYNSNSHLNIVGLVNACVHVVMYFYYLLSSIRPDVKQSIWWKKYVTLLQLAQFTFLLIFLSYPLLEGDECGYPLKFLPFSVFQNVVVFVLFINFYRKTYTKNAKLKAK